MPPIAMPEADERPRVAGIPAPRGALDDGALDGGALDDGAPDDGALDGGAPDGGALDGGALDAGAPDSAAPEVGAPQVAAGEVTAPQVVGSEVAAQEVAAPEAPDVPAAPPAADSPAPSRPASRRRLPHPPGRRAPLWLAALMAGGLVAAAPTVAGGQQVPTDASDYGLGISGVDPSGELADAGVRRGITEAEARVRLGELAASRAAREPKVVSPVASYRLTTCYCERWGQMHYGLDMAAPLGTPIYSAIDGVVLDAGPASGFGNAVYIQDENGDVHIYGHMRYYSVNAGEIVHAGDKIASVGNEGFSTGPHLHYEIHQGGRDGAPTDPEAWLESRDVAVG